MTDGLSAELLKLLDTSVEEVRERLQRPAAELTEQLREPLVVWGCGAPGKGIACLSDGTDVRIAAFVDRNSSLWNTDFCGRPVLSPEAIQDGYFRHALIALGIFDSEPVMRILDDSRRAYITFPELAWGFPHRFLPLGGLADANRLVAQADDVVAALGLWSDDASRLEYVRQLTWRTNLRRWLLPPHLPATETYFPNAWVSLREDEHFVDCGAFDGDTIRGFLKRAGSRFRRITAFEADPGNYKRLLEFVEGLSSSERARVHCVNKAVGAEAARRTFASVGGEGSRFHEAAEQVVDTVTLDSFCDDPPTFIKMDVEGSEPQALLGARDLIANARPTLAVCLYHEYDHLWSIPKLLASIVDDYRFHLGRHSSDCWEIVCYAVPAERSIAP